MISAARTKKVNNNPDMQQADNFCAVAFGFPWYASKTMENGEGGVGWRATAANDGWSAHMGCR